MPLGGQDLTASRWASTSRNTATFKRHHHNSNHHVNLNLETPVTTFRSASGTTTITTTTTSPSPLLNAGHNVTATTHNKTTPELTSAQKQFRSKTQAYQTFTKYSRRLKWKSSTLIYCHQRTLELIHNTHMQPPSNVIDGVSFPMEHGEPETMFKIDFFEFYAILESALVYLLKVFGTEISGMYAEDARTIDSDGSRRQQQRQQNNLLKTDSTGNNDAAEGSHHQHRNHGLIGDSKAILKSRHRFHANVLLALDDVDCPLREVMGEGMVRDYLGIAKEWRNKWKNVEDEEGKDERGDGLIGSRYEKLIKDLNLSEMLRDIVVAVEKGAILAQETLQQMHDGLSKDGLGGEGLMDIDVETNDLREMLPAADMMEWD